MLKPEYMGNTMKGQDLQKRYWVFIIMTYYPYGGLADIEFTTNCREAAIEFANEKITEYADHVQVLDTSSNTYEIIEDEQTC